MDKKEKEKLLKEIEKYTEKIKKDPDNDTYYHNRGATYHNLKEYEKAIEDYNKAIELNPNNTTSYNNIGAVYYNLKEYEKAIESCNSAIRLTPDYHLFYRNRGRIYSKLKRYQDAIKDYSEAIRLNPDNEIAKKLKDITFNYLNGNFKKTKASLISFRKEYKKSTENNLFVYFFCKS